MTKISRDFFEAFNQNDISEYSVVMPYEYYNGVEIPYPSILETNMRVWLREEEGVYA